MRLNPKHPLPMTINEEMEELVARYQVQSQSEAISMKTFCRTNGISYSRFLRYRRSRMPGEQPPVDLAPVEFVGADAGIPPSPCPAVEGLVLTFGGVSLRARSIESSTLLAIVRCLSSASPC